jgi:branched-chain amino acid transport system permease protein
MKALGRFWWIIVLLFIVLYPPTFGGMSAYKSGILIFVGIYIILAVSLDLLIGFAGQISVGHAAFFAIGAYVSGILTAKYGASPVVALIAGMALSGAVAWAVGRPVLALKEYYLAMATLALNEIVVTLIIGLQWLTGGASGLRDVPAFSVPGFTFDNHIHYYYFVWAIVLLVVASTRPRRPSASTVPSTSCASMSCRRSTHRLPALSLLTTWGFSRPMTLACSPLLIFWSCSI